MQKLITWVPCEMKMEQLISYSGIGTVIFINHLVMAQDRPF